MWFDEFTVTRSWRTVDRSTSLRFGHCISHFPKYADVYRMLRVPNGIVTYERIQNDVILTSFTAVFSEQPERFGAILRHLCCIVRLARMSDGSNYLLLSLSCPGNFERGEWGASRVGKAVLMLLGKLPIVWTLWFVLVNLCLGQSYQVVNAVDRTCWESENIEVSSWKEGIKISLFRCQL